jgi:ribosome-binding protein aMBF1 (putative translation factor)
MDGAIMLDAATYLTWSLWSSDPPDTSIRHPVASKSNNRRRPTATCRNFGRRVRTLRTRQGWTLERLAERAGMHTTYLSSIENGHRNPTLNIISHLATALNVELSELFEGLK